MKILKSILNYIPLATFIIFVVTDGIFSLISALIFVISTIGLLINWKRKKQRWRIEKIQVCQFTGDIERDSPFKVLALSKIPF